MEVCLWTENIETSISRRLWVKKGVLFIMLSQCDILDNSRMIFPSAWWRYQMETLSALLADCEGNPPVTGRFRSQRPVMLSFDVFFDQRLNKRSSKRWRRRWFETPSCSLWRQCNGVNVIYVDHRDSLKRKFRRIVDIFIISWSGNCHLNIS